MDPLSNDVRLDYLGRVHTALAETGRLIHVTTVTQAILSLLAILLALGSVTTKSGYELAGLTLELDSALIQFALGMAAVAALAYLVALMQHEADLRDELVGLYEALSLAEGAFKSKLLSPLEYPHIITTIRSLSKRPALHRLLAKPVVAVTKVAVTMFSIGLPLAADIVVTFVLFSFQQARRSGRYVAR